MSKQEIKKEEKPEEVIRAEQLIDDGKLDEALTLLNNCEQKEELTHLDKASCHLLHCQILFWQGKDKELIKQTEQTYKESGGRENNLFTVDNLLIMTYALVRLDRFDEAFDLMKQGEELVKMIPQELTEAYKQREAYLALIKGIFYNRRNSPNDADLALKHLEHSLALREELGIKHEIAETLSQMAFNLCVFKGELNRALKYADESLALAKESSKTYYIAFSLNILGIIYEFKGELDQSTIHYEQSLELFKELNDKKHIATVFNNLSSIYKMKGELDRALECIEQAMTLNRELGGITELAMNHDYLIQILIEKGDLERAQISLHDLEQLKTQLEGKTVYLLSLYNKALLLKESPRISNRGKAEEILKQILEDEDIFWEIKERALLTLCELLLIEFQMTNEVEVLDELESLITRLLENAEKSHSYWLMGETNLLQAKLALLSLDLNKAKESLERAQQIAEEYGLNQLTERISIEQDKLFSYTNKWLSSKNSTATIVELSNLAPLKEQIQYMLKKREILKRFNI